jgi:hypothetical protein
MRISRLPHPLVVNLEGLTRDVGCDGTYVVRMLRLTSLAPDIIEAIRCGDEPDGLSRVEGSEPGEATDIKRGQERMALP